jgi:hypothetical protein
MFKHSYQNLNHCRCQKPTETGLVSYGETIYDTFPTISAIKRRLAYMVRTFPGTMWHDPGHARRMNSVHCLTGYNPARNTNAYYAAVYLLSADTDLYCRTINCYTPTGIRFDRVWRRGISILGYDLLGAAKTIYYGTPDLTLEDLADCEIIDTETFQLIAIALLILRYGPEVLQIVQRRRREWDDG